MTNLPAYEELHIISDLHIGGVPGFQIFKETQRLANYILKVKDIRPDGRVALILNGDVIDTLAEDSGGYVATDKAVALVERILHDPSFACVWQALAEFVKTPNRTLVILIGNHDIELAFPLVQWTLLKYLAGDDLLAKARIEFSVAGAGYPCTVGKASVFCTHGNEVDPWNFVRYEELSKAARRLNANRPIPASDWLPNAGTKMVKDVMNSIKCRYAWIDLLKPETSAAVGVLLALDPSQLGKIKNVLPIVGQQLIEKGQVDQRLSADAYVAPALAATAQEPKLDQMLGANLLQELKPKDTQKSIDDMLLAAERPHTPVAGQDQGTLGVGQLLIDKLKGVSPAESLRRALQDWLKDDKTFDIADKDETYTAVTAGVGDDIDFIVTGHTHLERAIERSGNRYYFNCGTWIRLLRCTDDLLKDAASFTTIYDILKKGKMSDIDESKGFVLDQTSAVCIKVGDNGEVTGALLHVIGDDAELKPVQTFTRI